MTATKKPTLPDHNGETVDAAKIKFGGLGTGFAGLDVQPIFMDLDDVGYFVMKAKSTASPSAERTPKGELFWMNRLSAEMMAPIDKDTAERVLSEYAEEVARRRDEVDGQMRLDAEHEAEARERADEASTGNARSTQTEG